MVELKRAKCCTLHTLLCCSLDFSRDVRSTTPPARTRPGRSVRSCSAHASNLSRFSRNYADPPPLGVGVVEHEHGGPGGEQELVPGARLQPFAYGNSQGAGGGLREYHYRELYTRF